MHAEDPLVPAFGKKEYAAMPIAGRRRRLLGVACWKCNA